MDSRSNLVGWFWFRVSLGVVGKISAGATSSEALTGVEYLFSR